MDNYLKCPHCNSINFSAIGKKDKLNEKLFIPTIEMDPEGNKINIDNGYAMNGYICRDCKIVTFAIPNA